MLVSVRNPGLVMHARCVKKHAFPSVSNKSPSSHAENDFPHAPHIQFCAGTFSPIQTTDVMQARSHSRELRSTHTFSRLGDSIPGGPGRNTRHDARDALSKSQDVPVGDVFYVSLAPGFLSLPHCTGGPCSTEAHTIHPDSAGCSRISTAETRTPHCRPSPMPIHDH